MALCCPPGHAACITIIACPGTAELAGKILQCCCSLCSAVSLQAVMALRRCFGLAAKLRLHLGISCKKLCNQVPVLISASASAATACLHDWRGLSAGLLPVALLAAQVTSTHVRYQQQVTTLCFLQGAIRTLAMNSGWCNYNNTLPPSCCEQEDICLSQMQVVILAATCQSSLRIAHTSISLNTLFACRRILWKGSTPSSRWSLRATISGL